MSIYGSTVNKHIQYIIPILRKTLPRLLNHSGWNNHIGGDTNTQNDLLSIVFAAAPK